MGGWQRRHATQLGCALWVCDYTISPLDFDLLLSLFSIYLSAVCCDSELFLCSVFVFVCCGDLQGL